MDRKRKWDQPAPEDESPSKLPKTDDTKSASDAAAAAAAIAAKIAAQFAGSSGGAGILGDRKDPHDGEYTHDIEINDVRNRYMLTKGPTQSQILQETGASVTTKGIWYPDKSKATEKDPPLYLHISATTEESLRKAIARVEEMIATEMPSLIEEKRGDRKPRTWISEKLFVNLEPLRNFNVRAKVVGPKGDFVKYIQSETNTRVQIKGQGSGFFDTETGCESKEPMHIHITGPIQTDVDLAKLMTEDLLEVVRAEHAKARAVLHQQQMELHQAQMPYAMYPGYPGYGGAQPPGEAPPPPPGEAPPPPPPEDGSAPPPPPDSAPPLPDGTNGPSPQTSHDAFVQYWAAYGYDVNSEEFKKWMASQQQQYAQYYAAPGGEASADGSNPPPPPPSEAPPPPPPTRADA
ncbi:hypothetical protein FRB99_001866 [Tulasnella sp. 403]|nr:hypothetical protein FRB99_001866 [Tulasnella sp. 403]